MLGRKRLRQKGKLGLSRAFADINEGDKVALVSDLSFSRGFPERFQGKTGTVIGKQGKAIIVSVYDGKREKKFIVQRIHLKKLSS